MHVSWCRDLHHFEKLLRISHRFQHRIDACPYALSQIHGFVDALFRVNLEVSREHCVYDEILVVGVVGIIKEGNRIGSYSVPSDCMIVELVQCIEISSVVVSDYIPSRRQEAFIEGAPVTK